MRHYDPACGQQEVYGGASLSTPIQIFPGTFDFHIGLVHRQLDQPGACGREMLIQPGRILRPTIEREWSTSTPRSSIISSICR